MSIYAVEMSPQVKIGLNKTRSCACQYYILSRVFERALEPFKSRILFTTNNRIELEHSQVFYSKNKNLPRATDDP